MKQIDLEIQYKKLINKLINTNTPNIQETIDTLEQTITMLTLSNYSVKIIEFFDSSKNLNERLRLGLFNKNQEIYINFYINEELNLIILMSISVYKNNSHTKYFETATNFSKALKMLIAYII